MENVKKGIQYVVYALIFVQIGLGIYWIFRNFMNIPCFGDSTEYIKLSESLQIDEYRTILYPLILKVAIAIQNRIHIPFQALIYIGQFVLSFASIYYTCYVVLSDGKDSPKCTKLIIYTLGIITIPIINFLNFTILTDSLALSFLLVILVQIIKVWKSNKVRAGDVVLLAIAFLLEALMRADRIYSCTLFLVVYSLIQLAKHVDWKRFAIVVAVILLTAGSAFGINRQTQTKGLYNRVETNLDFILLDRVVWPNMADNYDDFSNEIKATISFEEAAKFDEHNNNVMYYLAPKVEERVGKERASQMYREMAKVVWKNEPGKVILDTAKCFLGFLFPHTNAYLSYRGWTETNNGWNLHCWSMVTPQLSDWYFHYYTFVFGIVLFAVAILVSIIRLTVLKNKDYAHYMKKLLPYFWMAVLICAWFSLGDGAPPNDRYVTLCHLVWNLFIYGTLVDLHNVKK